MALTRHRAERPFPPVPAKRSQVLQRPLFGRANVVFAMCRPARLGGVCRASASQRWFSAKYPPSA